MQNREITKIQSTLSEEFVCDFVWQWNIPHASHQNGVVESLIKSVRWALNSVCKKQAFTEEQWRCFLAKVTYMINSRSIYPNSEDVWEEAPITPNDIPIGRHSCPPQPDQEARVILRHSLRVSKTGLLNFRLVGWSTLLHRGCLGTSGFVKERTSKSAIWSSSSTHIGIDYSGRWRWL